MNYGVDTHLMSIISKYLEAGSISRGMSTLENLIPRVMKEPSQVTPQREAYRYLNKMTGKIVESANVRVDEFSKKNEHDNKSELEDY